LKLIGLRFNRAYLRLSAILLCVVISVFPLCVPGSARETYVQYANHLVKSPPEGASFSPSLEGAILASVNAYRRSQGYAALLPATAKIAFAARAQAMDLLVQGRVGHFSSNGYSFESRMRAQRPGVMNLPSMGENAARSTRHGLNEAETAHYIVQQWINSSAHRKAMVSRDYLTVATGVAQRGGDTYAVQIFVGPEVKSNLNLPQQ
jgi:uncharacterized protein YkwD